MFKETPKNIPEVRAADQEKQTRLLAEAEKFWVREEFEVNGRKIDFHGVIHDFDILRNEKYRRELEEGVKNSSLAVLEAAPEAQGFYTKEFETAYLNFFSAQGQRLSREEARRRIRGNIAFNFFHELEKVAARHKKIIATIDPMTFKWFAGEKLLAFDYKVQIGKNLAALFGTVGFLAAGGLDSLGRSGKNLKEENKNAGLSRRNFLKGMFGFATGLSYISFIASILKNVNPSAKSINPLEKFLYEMDDYRETAIAKGLDELTKKIPPEPGPIMAVFGSAHAKGLKHFTSSPAERDLKYKTYLPYRTIAPYALRLFKHNERYGWTGTEQTEL